jgi:eukaryotic-like serine/threonine-protein kinase
MIWRAAAIVCAVALAAALVPLVRHLREAPPPPPPLLRLALAAPQGAELGAGDEVLDAAISPDGREMVFVATAGGVTQLWRRSLDTDAAEPLPNTVGAAHPAWKPDGRTLSFAANGKIRVLSRANGTVSDLVDAPGSFGSAWLPDGSLLFATGGSAPIRRLRNGAVTDATTLKPGDLRHAFPAPAADLGFLYVATLDSGRRVVRLSASGIERDLTTTSSHAQLVDGRLLLVRDNALVAQRLDADTSTLAGRSVPLAFDVGVSPSGHGFFAASPRLLAWGGAAARARQLEWLDLDTGVRSTIGEPADIWQARLSPDDRSAAVTLLDPLLRTLDVFILPLSGSVVPRRLTRAIAADSDPVWSEEGDRVLFRSLQGGQPNLFARAIDGDGASEDTIMRSELDETATDWREGTVLLQAPANGTLDLWTFEQGRNSVTEITSGGFNEFGGRWSPDQHLLAYVSDESGRADVYVAPWPQSGNRVRVSFAGGTRPEWSADGRTLFFLREGRLMRAELSAAAGQDPPFEFSAPVAAADLTGVRDYSPGHTSRRVLVVAPAVRTAAPATGVVVEWGQVAR